MDAPAQHQEPNAFPPLNYSKRPGCWGPAQLCLLAPDSHPSGSTSTAGLRAGQFPNPFCYSAGSCQSSLCPPAKVAFFTFTPCAGSTPPVSFRGSTRVWARHPESGQHPQCLLPWVLQDKAFCSDAAAGEIAAYRYSCLLKAAPSLGCILK